MWSKRSQISFTFITIYVMLHGIVQYSINILINNIVLHDFIGMQINCIKQEIRSFLYPLWVILVSYQYFLTVLCVDSYRDEYCIIRTKKLKWESVLLLSMSLPDSMYMYTCLSLHHICFSWILVLRANVSPELFMIRLFYKILMYL